MWREDPVGTALPVACRNWEKALPDARWRAGIRRAQAGAQRQLQARPVYQRGDGHSAVGQGKNSRGTGIDGGKKMAKRLEIGGRKRAALYVRVSTDHQSVENQIRDLRHVARRRGWGVIETYNDAGISGAKGRDKRPGLDALLKDASRGKFDVVLAWAIDRLGRSLIDLLSTIQHLEACKVDLYLDQQAIDTTTPMGKLVFQVTGAFAEFERSIIRQRVRAGLRRAVAQGKVLGRPKLPAELEERIRAALNAPDRRGTRVIARQFGVSRPTILRIASDGP